VGSITYNNGKQHRQYVIYESKTPGFSSFAITAEKALAASSITDADASISSEGSSSEHIPTGDTNQDQASEKSNVWISIAAILVIGTVTASYVYLKRKQNLAYHPLYFHRAGGIRKVIEMLVFSPGNVSSDPAWIVEFLSYFFVSTTLSKYWRPDCKICNIYIYEYISFQKRSTKSLSGADHAKTGVDSCCTSDRSDNSFKRSKVPLSERCKCVTEDIGFFPTIGNSGSSSLQQRKSRRPSKIFKQLN
jgi:hypothetical protein